MNIETKVLITPEMITPTLKNFRVRGAINPGGIRLPDKKIMLYARIAETPYHDNKNYLVPRFVGKNELKVIMDKIPRRRGKVCPDCFIMDTETYLLYRLPTISHFRKIILDESGEQVEKISQSPDFFGLMNDGDFGVEDARMTFFRSENRYAMTYVSVSLKSGVTTSLATSTNLSNWKREGVIFRPQNKDVVLFPEKINGYYVALNRPEGTMIFDKPSIWLSYSKDLLFWGRDRPLLRPRDNSWEHVRVGAGTVPIKTSEGWLEIYHGVRLKNRNNANSKKIYSAGAMLFGLKDPSKILAKTPKDNPLFEPTTKEEKHGFMNNVVFPTAAIESLDKKSLLVYCGAADSNTVLKKLRVSDILNSLEFT
ncbi:MAG: hypothetical protein AABW99_02930 [archaeon]